MFKALTVQLSPNGEGALVQLMVWLFGVSWKSSLSGFLSFMGLTLGVITSGLAPLAALNPSSALARYSAIGTAISTIMCGLGKAWVGLLIQDKGTELATMPNSSEPVVVPAHEMPDDPAATPVAEKKP